MSVRCRSASPGVSRTHGTEAITGRSPAPASRPHRSGRRRCRRVGRAGRRARRPSRSRGPGRAAGRGPVHGALRRTLGRRRRRRAERRPRTDVLCPDRARADRPATAANSSSASLGIDATAPLVPAISSTRTRTCSALVHGEAEALRGRRQCRLASLRPARACVDHQQVHPERVAGVDGGEEELARPPERGRVPRGDVPDVRQVRDARGEAARGQALPEPLDLRIVIARRGPCPRIGDEDLDAVGAAERGLLDRTLDAGLPAPDVGAQDHA